MDIKKRFFYAILTILIAYFYKNNILKMTTNYEREIIESWDDLISLPDENKHLTVLIGLNTNVDLIVSAVDLFRCLNISTNVECCLDHKTIGSMNDFKQTFTYFFQRGAAAERFFTNRDEFMRILHACDSINKKWFVGGNAALMAQSISNRFPNTRVILVGPIGNRLSSMLNKNITTPLETYVHVDEIHLILEYARDEEFEGMRASRANRFIVSNDYVNSRMQMLNLFFEIQSKYENIDRIILSGLHLLESQASEFRQEKLRALNAHLVNKIDQNTAIHLELASIADESFLIELVDSDVLSQIHSLGLNEQELLFLSYAKNGPHSAYFKEHDSQPHVKKVLDILEWIFISYGYNSDSKQELKLSRIHFHSLTYHIIGIADTHKWSNTVSSLMSASKMASKQACDHDFHDSNDANEFHTKVEYRFVNDDTYKFSKLMPFIKFKRGNIHFYLTPVLVCKNPLKTVGLGDAISSTGLIYAQFNAKK